MEPQTIFVHTTGTRQVLRSNEGRAYTWLYLGKSISEREHVSSILGEGNRYSLDDRLQRTAYAQRDGFVEFIATLGRYQNGNISWMASSIAHKSPHASDFFLYWCYSGLYEAVRSEVAQKGLLLVVVVEDRWLLKYFAEYHQNNRIDVWFTSRTCILGELIRSTLRGTVARTVFCSRMFIRYCRNRLGRQEATNQPPTSGNAKRIYIYSWVEERFFKNGRFVDAYFGRLPHMAHEQGVQVTYITPPFLSQRIKRKCRKNNNGYEFLFLDEFIGLSDILVSTAGLLRIRIPETVNTALRVLLRREVARELVPLPQKSIYYYAFRRLFFKLKAGSIIYPFENQPWAKLLCRAAQTSGCSIYTIGYQHTSVSPLMVSYFLGNGEFEMTPLPDLLVANSAYTFNLLKDAGYGQMPIVNGGALRYEHLHGQTKTSPGKAIDRPSVLVAFPGSRTLTEEMLLAVFRQLGDQSQIDVLLKFHPDTPFDKADITLPFWPEHFHQVRQPVQALFADVHMVIYSSSTVGLEALISNIPVVKYYSETILEHDPLGDLANTIIPGCSERNLRQAVIDTLHGKNRQLHQTERDRIVAQLLSPVNEAVWHRIIAGENPLDE